MLKVALKGLATRKLRTALTGFAVVLGVAFVAGTFVFTDTIDASFKDLFERTQKGTDVSVQARLAVEEDFAPPPTMPERHARARRSRCRRRRGGVRLGLERRARCSTARATRSSPTARRRSSSPRRPKRFDPFELQGGRPADDR